MATLQIVLETEGMLQLPIAYNNYLQAVVYRLMDERLADLIHDGGHNEGNRSYKFFTFSRLAGEKVIIGKEIVYNGKLHWEIRSPSQAFARSIAESMAEKKKIFIKGNSLKIVGLSLEEKEIVASQVNIKMITPLDLHVTLDNHKTRYFGPKEDGFNELFEENFRRKYRAYTGKYPEGNVSITPTAVRDRDKVVTTFKQIYITGWNGRYRLEGKPEYLTFLYNTGLGARNSQGFGMYEITE